ncbi:hypothetical protein FHX37_0828 [Haloactinospora alba]|uniref:Uncharacterized protein n=1 Tax=Haloactinospora alba TaxID=405555 RepID=A0A543NGH0_9ACTN|nr:hypothetical protein [Haloactinospora alba]TQN30939.1 hypothetical protein FHX37_0828 [Haloactinospora alba]
MPNAWMPDATRVEDTSPQGMFLGGAPRVVWLTTETDPTLSSARNAAHQLTSRGHSSHLVWNPVTGEIVQPMPVTAAALGQLDTGAVDRATEGRVCVIIRVIGYATSPFTNQPLHGLGSILTWLDSWEVPRHWPTGSPSARPLPHRDPQAERLWARGGHFGHSQVPNARPSGPGAISTERLLNWLAPRPREGKRPSPDPVEATDADPGTKAEHELAGP